MKAEMDLAERWVQIADAQGTACWLRVFGLYDHGLLALLSLSLSEGF